MITPIKRKGLLREDICSYIKELIISGELPEGTRIVESKLAKELGVSQSPVREAIHALQMMGFLVYQPYQGNIVRRITAKDMRQFYKVRIGLELIAIEDAVDKMTDEDLEKIKASLDQMIQAGVDDDYASYLAYDSLFHQSVIESAHNQVLERLWAQSNIDDWMNAGTKLLLHRELAELAHRHEEIYVTLVRRDMEAAKQAVKKHLDELLLKM